MVQKFWGLYWKQALKTLWESSSKDTTGMKLYRYYRKEATKILQERSSKDTIGKKTTDAIEKKL